MGKLDKDQVRALTHLARIVATDEEVALYSQQLSRLLDYVDQLKRIDTDGVEPTAQVTGITNVMRGDDDLSDTMPRERLLDQTPSVKDGQIKVPRVL